MTYFTAYKKAGTLRRITWCLLFLPGMFLSLSGAVAPSEQPEDAFRWGNATYFNLAQGEVLTFEGHEIELLRMHNHFNLLRVGSDTAWLKVSYRSPNTILGHLQVFIADNRHVASVSGDPQLHGLLKKDALVAVAPSDQPLTDRWLFAFPVSFTDGYLWKNDEDSYMFSYQGSVVPYQETSLHFPGVALDMVHARGTDKHAILAMEAGKILWVESRDRVSLQPKASICMESEASPGIYHIYRNLDNRKVLVNKNQNVVRGDALGYIWGDGNQENLMLTVVHSATAPEPGETPRNAVNFFPQLLDMYYGHQPVASQVFTKGQIHFGNPAGIHGNVKNVSAFEEYQGMGWILGKWNIADKVEWISSRVMGNARLSKVLFRGQPAECTNPENHYDYLINVKNGVYRIRASVGDLYLPTWQKVEFEGVSAGTFHLGKGEFTWTSEKVVRVRDGNLNVRIYTGDNNQVAGIREIVFQQASL